MTVLEQAGLPIAPSHDPALTIGTAQLFAIWRAIETLSGDVTFGIRMVRDTGAAAHKLAFLAVTLAANYRESIARLAGFKRLCSPDALRREMHDGQASKTTEWPPGTEPEPSLSVDVGFAIVIELARRGTGRRWPRRCRLRG